METNKKISPWVWVGIVVVVIIIVAVIILQFLPHGSSPSGSGTSPSVQTAPQGQVVSGFPQWLLVDEVYPNGTSAAPAGVTASYAVTASTSTPGQYTAQWTSSSTMASIYSDFLSVFAAKQWLVNNKTSATTFKGIYATTASSTANVVITPDGKGSDVKVTYVIGQ